DTTPRLRAAPDGSARARRPEPFCAIRSSQSRPCSASARRVPLALALCDQVLCLLTAASKRAIVLISSMWHGYKCDNDKEPGRNIAIRTANARMAIAKRAIPMSARSQKRKPIDEPLTRHYDDKQAANVT